MTEAQIRVVDASVKQMELGGVGLEGEVSTEDSASAAVAAAAVRGIKIVLFWGEG